ncbi:MAG TPA: hypothetical protein VLC53_06875, partial [Myxococcota bacterium]|nr:hypothetical protein [Myxococcota bacterium]
AVDPVEVFAIPSSTSVNPWAEVAFLSSPDGDGETLLAADGDAVWRVVCEDHAALFGNAPFFDLDLSPRAINAEGQIAFRARTSALVPGTGEFQTYVVRADPLPGHGRRPTSCSGLVDGTPCDDGDPETLSACSGGACTGDPIDRPTSCAGLPDDTPCDDGAPATFGYCAAELCVGVPIPEPRPAAAAALALLTLASLRRARPA